MAYFPAFVQLENKKILIVGGGYIALEKLEKLLDFTQEISIISKDFSDDMLKKMKDNIEVERVKALKAFVKESLEGKFPAAKNSVNVDENVLQEFFKKIQIKNSKAKKRQGKF